VKKFSDLLAFLSLDLTRVQKLRIVLGYYVLSRYGCIKILGIRIHYSKGSKNHSLLILKEIFLNQIYTFTNSVDQKLKNSAEDVVIIDIGANIGITVAYFKNKYPSVKLIAIEASPINYQQLVRNIEVNNFQNISTFNYFISNENKLIQFYHDSSKPGGSFGEDYRNKGLDNLEKFDVKTKKLNDVISGFKNIVIKIDVEGAEYEILKHLATSKDISEVLEITVEVSTYNLTDYNNLNIVLINFYQLGFEARFISDYTVSLLKAKSRQGHLQLVLFREIENISV
jgi:FkbM family methyltransferase